jgi:hypothetical protein
VLCLVCLWHFDKGARRGVVKVGEGVGEKIRDGVPVSRKASHRWGNGLLGVNQRKGRPG